MGYLINAWDNWVDIWEGIKLNLYFDTHTKVNSRFF